MLTPDEGACFFHNYLNDYDYPVDIDTLEKKSGFLRFSATIQCGSLVFEVSWRIKNNVPDINDVELWRIAKAVHIEIERHLANCGFTAKNDPR